jgi:diguanylate cyclase (GGDEF)-like protein/PAS domain S-box-containing protein
MMFDNYANASMLVLLIEDDDVDSEKIKRLLRKTALDVHVIEAKSTSQALTLLQQHEFDCAIVDYQLTDGLGSELIQKITTHKKIPTPVIMISGNTEERIIADAMRDGLFDYLPKRNLDEELLRTTLISSQFWADNEYHASEDRLRFNELAEGLPQLTWTCRPNGECDFLNRRWCEFTGVPMEQQLGFGWLDQVHPDDKEYLSKAWEKAFKSGNEMFAMFRIRRHDGDYRWFDTRATPQKNEQGEIVRWLGSNTDITEVELTRQALANSEQLFQAVFEHAPLGMVLVDLQGGIIKVNPAFLQLVGYDNNIFVEDREPLPKKFKEFIALDDRENTLFQLEKLRLATVSFAQFETHFNNRNGHTIPTLTSAAFISKFDNEPCYLLQVHDLSERKRYESQLIKLAHYDALTGLGNRAKLHEEIEFLIKKAHRSAAPFAVLFGDLDHFKEVNDTLGHEAGDQLLKVVARRLQKSLRHEDSVCRLGGDEFVILLQDVTKFEAVVSVADKLIKKISKPIKIGSQRVQVGMTLGVALHPTDGNDAKTLLRNADSALYEAKAKGRGTYQLYRKELTEYVHNRLLLDTDLRTAISQNQFELFYQPVVRLDNHDIAFVEALIRWHHPRRGMLGPDEFISYAQETGLIVDIGEWVVNQACAQAKQWNDAGFPMAISVNLSARQLVPQNFVGMVQQALATTGLPASRLIIEITEQMYLENIASNLKQIGELKSMGIKISLDDFGTGYSSLNYVMRFAPQYLKIDRSIINRIDTNEEQNTAIKTIIGLSKIIPMQIIAEGVEQKNQELFLRSSACELGQGFLFCQPLPQHTLLGYLQNQAHQAHAKSA